MTKKEVDVGVLIVSFCFKMILNLLELIKKVGTCFLLSPKVLHLIKAERIKASSHENHCRALTTYFNGS